MPPASDIPPGAEAALAPETSFGRAGNPTSHTAAVDEGLQQTLSILYLQASQDLQRSQLLKEVATRFEYMNHMYEKERQARHQAELDSAQCRQQLAHLESLEYNPFVLILIDGDGMLFQDQLIKAGEHGGKTAASKLKTSIKDCLRKEYDNVASRYQVVIRIYAHVRGLANVLVGKGIIPEITVFEDFVRGFTQSGSLYDFVDVGPGKDRAVGKIIENFKLHVKNSTCQQIFLGCSHDYGYARALEEYALDSRYIDKITLLEGVPFERELLNYQFQKKKFPELFRDMKLILNGWSAPQSGYSSPKPAHSPKPLNATAPNFNMINGLPLRFPPPPSRCGGAVLDSPWMPPVRPNIERSPSSSTLASIGSAAFRNGYLNPVGTGAPNRTANGTPNGTPNVTPNLPVTWATRVANASPVKEEAPSPVKREEAIPRNRAGQRVDPQCCDFDKAEVDRVKRLKLCNVHFLRNTCSFGAKCTHVHNAAPSKKEIDTLRLVARMSFCNNGSGCNDVKCIYGHRCPFPQANNPVKGTKSCLKGDKCKFPLDLHDIDMNVVKTLAREFREPKESDEPELPKSMKDLEGLVL